MLIELLVSRMYNIEKTATFNCMEGYLEIKVIVEPDDHMNVRIKACNVPGIGGELSYGISAEKLEIEKLV